MNPTVVNHGFKFALNRFISTWIIGVAILAGGMVILNTYINYKVQNDLNQRGRVFIGFKIIDTKYENSTLYFLPVVTKLRDECEFHSLQWQYATASDPYYKNIPEVKFLRSDMQRIAGPQYLGWWAIPGIPQDIISHRGTVYHNCIPGMNILTPTKVGPFRVAF